MNPLYLSRVRLLKEAPIGALSKLLVPARAGARADTAHRLIWALFTDSPDRDRDFLWREASDGTYYTLSQREPEDVHGIFEIDPPKLFQPVLHAGDRLAFALRANATVARSGSNGARGKPCDVVMDALRHLPHEERAAGRSALMQSAGRAWLERQGEKSGFSLDDRAASVRVLAYRPIEIRRERARPARIGVLDLEGVLRVEAPDRFIEAVGRGFGRAKAFGCGLMLLRRC